MNLFRPSPGFALAIMTTQLFGPATLWAAEQRGVPVDATRQIVVSAVSGNQLTVQGESSTKALRFRDMLVEGARVMTGSGTTADLLIGNRAVVNLDNETMVQVHTVSSGQTTIQVVKGTVRIAAAASALGERGVVTVQTPTGQVQTRGGIVRVLVETPVGKAEPVPTGEAKSYRTSSTPGRLVVAGSPQSEFIQVEEGEAEILEASGKTVTIQTGQSVMLERDKAGTISEGVRQDHMRPGVVATLDHNQTSKEGRDYLVALQVDQATKLGKKLTDPVETTGKGESDKKSDSKNVINGATGGITLVSTNLVNALFGNGSAANPSVANIDLNRTGAGYGSNNNADFAENSAEGARTSVNDKNALLVFTRQDPVEAFVVKDGTPCDSFCLSDHQTANSLSDLEFRPVQSVPSQVTVTKELVLVGGTPNIGHGGLAPEETLIVRGPLQGNQRIAPFDGALEPLRFPPQQIVSANSRFVVQTPPTDVGGLTEDGVEEVLLVGGTLGRFSNLPDPRGIAIRGQRGAADGQIDGAITSTTDLNDPNRRTITLKGGVSLDQGTIATIGTTTASDTYFRGLTTNLGRTFSGSLLSVIDGPNERTSLIMKDRMLGVYDGSQIKTDGGNKALLSVLDAKLKGPSGSIPLIDIAKGQHFAGSNEAPNRISTPDVQVTSAVVVRSTISLPLDGALLEASAPLFALTQANMTTTSHFADLAGNASQSLNLNGAMVALNAANLIIEKEHLLNLNSASAAITGYLFSLTNTSGLDIKDGVLFSLTDSSLTLNGNAFGVFGSGANRLTINNHLCAGTCGMLVNSANQPFVLNGTPLKVAGVDHNVVLPNSFNVFAGNAATKVTVGAPGATDAALFQLDAKSHLTINGVKVQ